MSQQGGPEKRQLTVRINEDLKHGTYANALVASHSRHEFTLDFCQLQPSGDGSETVAEVVARVRVAPTLIGNILQTLNTNMTNYEERFGMISRDR